MNINFGMWQKAAWELIKMEDKKEWDALDVISKWLIATRSAVAAVTVYSSIIAGLLFWRAQSGDSGTGHPVARQTSGLETRRRRKTARDRIQ